MMRWQDISIRNKLTLLVTTAVAGMLIFGSVAFYTLNQIGIGSKLSRDNHLIASIIGDYEDPVMSVLNAYPWAARAQRATSAGEIASCAQRVHSMRAAYEAGFARYDNMVPAGPMRDEIFRGNQTAGIWFGLAEERYFPLLEHGDREGAQAVWLRQMEPAVADNSASIERITALVERESAENDRATAEIVRARTLLMILIGIAMVLLIGLLGFAISRAIADGIARTVTMLEALANCDLRVESKAASADEIGMMQIAVHRTILNFRSILGAIRNGSEQVAAASTEISTSLTQMTGSNAQQLNAFSESTATFGRISNFVQHAVVATDEAARACRNLSMLAEDLNQQADRFRLPPD
jgi:methyl-accepting chemotaxis protein